VVSPDGAWRQPDRRIVITALGAAQILAWGTSFYFPAVFAEPIVHDTGWPLAWVIGQLPGIGWQVGAIIGANLIGIPLATVFAPLVAS